MRKICDFIIQAGLIFLIIFTPLAFGSVELWAVTIMEFIIVSLATFWLLRMIILGEIHLVKTSFYLPLFLFLALIAFQLVPLPPRIMKIISPHTYTLQSGGLPSSSPTTLISYPGNPGFNSPIPAPGNNKFNILPSRHPGAYRPLTIHQNATQMELFRIISYMALFILLISTLTNYDQLNRLITLIIFVGFVISVFGIIQKMGWNGKIYWVRELTRGGGPFGPFVNRNNYAGYIGLIIPLCLGKVIIESAIEKKLLFGFMAIIMTSSLFYSLSRGGVASLLLAFFFMVIFLSFIQKRVKVRWAFAAFALCVFLYLLYLGIEPIIDRLSTVARRDTITQNLRWQTWKANNGIIKDFPVFGTGLDTFEHIFPLYQLPPLRQHYLDAHNDYLQLLAETGLAGLGLIGWFFISYFWTVLRRLRIQRNYEVVFLTAGGLAGIVAILTSCLFTFNLHIPANALLLTIILALTFALVNTGCHYSC